MKISERAGSLVLQRRNFLESEVSINSPFFQALIDDGAHNTFNRSIIEPVLGLSLKLGIGQLDRDNNIQPLLYDFRLEALLLAAFNDSPLESIVIDDFGKGRFEACFMHSAITGTHSICKAIHRAFVACGWLEGYLYLYTVFFLCHTDDLFKKRSTGAYCQFTHIIR